MVVLPAPLLWNDNGYLGAYMNGDRYDFRCVLADAAKSEWTIHGFGDYDGDGCEDILARNSVGTVGCWSCDTGFKWKNIGFGVENTWAVIA